MCFLRSSKFYAIEVSPRTFEFSGNWIFTDRSQDLIDEVLTSTTLRNIKSPASHENGTKYVIVNMTP